MMDLDSIWISQILLNRISIRLGSDNLVLNFSQTKLSVLFRNCRLLHSIPKGGFTQNPGLCIRTFTVIAVCTLDASRAVRLVCVSVAGAVSPMRRCMHTSAHEAVRSQRTI